MKLTEAQRWILINQYEIMAKRDPKDKKHCEDAIEALQSGYELHYREFANMPLDEDPITPEECREVIDILSMYRAITFSYRDLEDKTGITESDVEFDGFDGNEEGKLYSYTQWFLNWGHGRFQELSKADDCNSHTQMLETYRAMFAAWEEMGKPQRMTKQHLQRLIDIKYPYR